CVDGSLFCVYGMGQDWDAVPLLEGDTLDAPIKSMAIVSDKSFSDMIVDGVSSFEFVCGCADGSIVLVGPETEGEGESGNGVVITPVLEAHTTAVR
ncbi:hypothetical protein KIPB_013732, partial [Kipferlia bialata]